MFVIDVKKLTIKNYKVTFSVLLRPWFCYILTKKIQLSPTKSPFVAYEFEQGRIINKYAVNSPDKQTNDRKESKLFVFDL